MCGNRAVEVVFWNGQVEVVFGNYAVEVVFWNDHVALPESTSFCHRIGEYLFGCPYRGVLPGLPSYGVGIRIRGQAAIGYASYARLSVLPKTMFGGITIT